MKTKEISDFIEEYYPDYPNLLLADGFEDAFVGVVDGNSLPPKVCYDYDECIKILERDMSYEEAIEYFNYNVEGAYVGEHTPCFMKSCKNEILRSETTA
tara:strand:- start:228 stop:524 length:297 start_codon:yes stop_codon:yes gene_type:complete